MLYSMLSRHAECVARISFRRIKWFAGMNALSLICCFSDFRTELRRISFLINQPILWNQWFQKVQQPIFLAPPSIILRQVNTAIEKIERILAFFTNPRIVRIQKTLQRGCNFLLIFHNDLILLPLLMCNNESGCSKDASNLCKIKGFG